MYESYSCSYYSIASTRAIMYDVYLYPQVERFSKEAVAMEVLATLIFNIYMYSKWHGAL
jgi:hypothetical protein